MLSLGMETGQPPCNVGLPGGCVLKVFGERRAGLKQLEGKGRTLAQDFPMAKRAV